MNKVRWVPGQGFRLFDSDGRLVPIADEGIRVDDIWKESHGSGEVKVTITITAWFDPEPFIPQPDEPKTK
jgi:hypothetical protein